MRGRLLRLLLAAFAALGLPPGDASAEDLRKVLTGYNISSWGAADGLPSGEIRTMAQDVEGYLWLGTESGLARFDGLRFMPWAALGSDPLPRRSVRALLVSRAGDLWIGFGEQGGVTRVLYPRRPNGVRHYLEADGLSPGQLTTLVEDRHGSIWAGTSAGLFRFTDDRWRRWTARGLPDGPIHAAFVDSEDRLFVSTSPGVFVLTAGEESFKQVGLAPRRNPILRRGAGPPDDLVGAISVDLRGRIWLADRLAGFRVVDGASITTAADENGRGRCLLSDRSGNMWVGTAGQGLWRVKQAASDRLTVDHSTELTGLMGNGVMSLLEDRDGNIWAATIEGLNRLMPRQATMLNDLGLVAGMEVDAKGTWVAASAGILRFEGASSDALRRLQPSGPAAVTAMHTDERGRLWLASGNRLATVTRGRRHDLEIRDLRNVRSIDLATSDRRGGVWLYDQGNGILRWDGKTLLAPAISAEAVPRELLWMDTQRDGSLWLMGTDGRVAVLSPDGRINEYGAHEGLEGDVYRAMYEDRQGAVWLGGAGGLTRFARGRFQTLRRLNGHALVNLTAVVEDEGGSIWVGTSSAVVNFSPGDFDQALASPSNRIPYRLYTSDTLAGNPRWYGQRAAIRAVDGRLWFVTSRGVTVIDPRLVPEKRDSLPVRIDGIVVDGQMFAPTGESRLPAGTKNVEVGFSALALTTPERTHVRYRLDGFDTQWVEVGVRRQATYTNLSAGRYRFQVMASRADGTWPETGAVWAFSVAPMFYRRPWFLIVALSLFGLGVVGAWRLHLRQVRMRFSLLLGERARLSREIHDTLLQGLFGVALRCDAIASELETSAPRIREHFITMRRDVEEYIREARQSIWNLRSPKLDQLGLVAALRESGEHATTGQPVRFVFGVTGTPTPCPRVVEEQLLRIGQEAVANAVHHAHASEIKMELRYEATDVVLHLSDDGHGFEPEAAGGNGHYGLISMRERAEVAGGQVRIVSRTGHGTRVEARLPYGRIPARIA